MRPGVFVTGTDTGAGKTVASCALVHALRAAGLRVHPFKPVAAGGVPRAGGWVNEDTLALIRAAGLGEEAAADVTPLFLRDAIAPHIAAAREGRVISIEEIHRALDRLPRDAWVVAEGVGGFKVPLGDTFDSSDLCRALGLPVVLVVGMRLGCLNHALLSAQAIEAAGLDFAGWIANAIDPPMAALEENVAALRTRLRAPLLARFPWRAPPDPAQFATLCDVGALLARGGAPR